MSAWIAYNTWKKTKELNKMANNSSSNREKVSDINIPTYTLHRHVKQNRILTGKNRTNALLRVN